MGKIVFLKVSFNFRIEDTILCSIFKIVFKSILDNFKMVRTKWCGQNSIGQNGTDKMKYGQNGTDKTVPINRLDHNVK